jgi:hypothetical protein
VCYAHRYYAGKKPSENNPRKERAMTASHVIAPCAIRKMNKKENKKLHRMKMLMAD